MAYRLMAADYDLTLTGSDRKVSAVVDGTTVYRRARFFLPYAADVTEADRIRRPDGSVFKAAGPRADWANPLTGRRAGSVIEAEVVT